MFSKAEMKEMWEEIKQNNARWRACPQHYFPVGQLAEKGLTRKVTCCKCHATADVGNAINYARGWVAHGGKLDEVFPDLVGKDNVG